MMNQFFSQHAGRIQIGAIAFLLVLTFFMTRPPSVEDVLTQAEGRAHNADKQQVTVIRPQATTTVPLIKTTGTMEVRSYITMSSEVSGRVIGVSDSLRAGGVFDAGEVLLRIDPDDFELSLEQARADVAATEATLKLRVAESEAAIENYALLNGDAVVPPLVAKEPQIDQAKAQLLAAQAREKVAALALSRTKFSLPFAGQVTESSVAAGQLLSQGQPFGRAFANQSIEATVPLTVEELGLISPLAGRKAVIWSNDIDHPATVDRMAAELDAMTRFAAVYLNTDSVIPPGTFVDVEISGAPQADTFLLPETTRQLNETLWIVEGDMLREITPELIATTSEGMVVRAFDYKNGIVQGVVPGAMEGLAVSITESLSP